MILKEKKNILEKYTKRSYVQKNVFFLISESKKVISWVFIKKSFFPQSEYFKGGLSFSKTTMSLHNYTKMIAASKVGKTHCAGKSGLTLMG